MGVDAIPLPLAVPVRAAETPRRYETPTVNNGSCYTALCEDGEVRFLKGSDVNPKAPCNEWVAAQICVAAGFAVLDPCIVTWKDRKFYGAPYQRRPTFGGPEARPFTAAWNAESVIYEAMALDAFLANPDRHHGNLMVSAEILGEVVRYSAYLFDHERAVLSAPGVVPHFQARLNHFSQDPIDGWIPKHTAWIREECAWHEHISKWSRLLRAAGRIASIPRQHIRAIVDSVPQEWIDRNERASLLKYLLRRQRKIQSVIEARKHVFSGITET